jgi:desulfoferrodoxin (superoxide reductase-like protein)
MPRTHRVLLVLCAAVTAVDLTLIPADVLSALSGQMELSNSAETGPSSFHVANSRAPAKHDPFVAIDGDIATVSVRGGGGSTAILHPQIVDHYIADVWVTNQLGVVIWAIKLSSINAAGPSTSFTIPPGTTSMTPYAYCTKHGLWAGPQYAVALETAVSEIMRDLDAASTSGPRSFHQRGGSTSAPVKHDPFLTLRGEFATVAVRGTGGSATTLHPQDADHYITAIFVTNQHGAVVHFGRLATSNGSRPAVSFLIPAGTTSLTPYSHCNLHGLFTTGTTPVNLPFYCDSNNSGPLSASHSPVSSADWTNHSVRLDKNLKLEWQHTPGSAHISFSLSVRKKTWLGLAVTDMPSMVAGPGLETRLAYIGLPSTGAIVMHELHAQSEAEVKEHKGKPTFTQASFSHAEPGPWQTVMSFTELVAVIDRFNVGQRRGALRPAAALTNVSFIFAYGDSKTFGFHGGTGSMGYTNINLIGGTAVVVPAGQGNSGGGMTVKNLHGVTMALTWALCTTFGVIAARYRKVWDHTYSLRMYFSL